MRQRGDWRSVRLLLIVLIVLNLFAYTAILVRDC